MPILPVEKNIRFRGFPKQQRWIWGVPVVHGGDWMAERAAYGQPERLVYYRQPWTGSPYVRTPAAPLPAGMGDNGLLEQGMTMFEQARSEAESRIAAQASEEMMERIRPYLLWGTIGLFGVGALGLLLGYSLGRSA